MYRKTAVLAFVLIGAALLLRSVVATGDLWGAIKPVLVPPAILFINTFNSPLTALLLCLAMVVLAVVLYYHFAVNSIGPVRRDLAALRSELAAINTPNGSAATLTAVAYAMRRHGDVRLATVAVEVPVGPTTDAVRAKFGGLALLTAIATADPGLLALSEPGGSDILIYRVGAAGGPLRLKVDMALPALPTR